MSHGKMLLMQPAGHDDQAQGVQLVDARGVSALGVAGPPAVLDPNRAFQAINAETLEAAAQDMQYPIPPQQVPWLTSEIARHQAHLPSSDCIIKIIKILQPKQRAKLSDMLQVSTCKSCGP